MESRAEVVVHRLRDADDVGFVLLEELGGDAEGVLAAHGDERVEVQLLERLEHGGDAALLLEGVGAGGP
jgi:aminoglycoside/choline kinase family phosphotransferase